MEDRKRPRLNRETVNGARVILLDGTGYWSQSVLKQIRIRTKTGYFNFSRMGEGNEGAENNIPQKPCGRGKGLSRQFIDGKRNKIGSEKGAEAYKIA